MLTAIFGRRQSGKTELTRQISYELANTGGLVLVYDLMRQWPADYHIPISELYARKKLDSRLYCVHDCEPEDAAQVALKWSPCTFIVDEVDLICGGPTSWKSPTARNIVRRGRHYPGGGVSFLVNGQRFVNCHTDILSLADHISVFFMNHFRDLQVIRDWMGPEYSEEVQRLKQHEFLTYPDGVVSKIGLGGAPAFSRYIGEDNSEPECEEESDQESNQEYDDFEE